MSKSNYFETYLDKNKNDTSLIWKGIRQLLTFNCKCKRQPNIISIKGKGVTIPKNIANALSKFFLKI